MTILIICLVITLFLISNLILLYILSTSARTHSIIYDLIKSSNEITIKAYNNDSF